MTEVSKKHERREAMDFAIEAVYRELSSMNPRKFKKELKKHENGDIANMLKYTGALKILNQNRERCRKFKLK